MASVQNTAVVTGANRGLGLGVVDALARRGYRVILTSRDAQQGRQVEDRLKAKGLDVSAERLDVGSVQSIAEFAARLKENATRVDVLVNNAGVSRKGFDEEVAKHTIEVNTLGPWRVSDALLPLMSEGARVVMVSSGMGELSAFGPDLQKKFQDPELTRSALHSLLESFVAAVREGTHERLGWPTSAYRVSKAGLNAFTRILARELSNSRPGVLVNAVCPGWVRTDMGGPNAPRNLAEGTESIVWATHLPEGGPSGGFFRDGEPIAF